MTRTLNPEGLERAARALAIHASGSQGGLMFKDATGFVSRALDLWDFDSREEAVQAVFAFAYLRDWIMLEEVELWKVVHTYVMTTSTWRTYQLGYREGA